MMQTGFKYDCTLRFVHRADKFTGKERDSESGLDYFEARFFGSALGRFTSPDPENANGTVSDPQSWNGYAYARNNPLVFTDPDGETYKICDGAGVICTTTDQQLGDTVFEDEQKAAKANGRLKDRTPSGYDRRRV